MKFDKPPKFGLVEMKKRICMICGVELGEVLMTAELNGDTHGLCPKHAEMSRHPELQDEEYKRLIAAKKIRQESFKTEVNGVKVEIAQGIINLIENEAFSRENVRQKLVSDHAGFVSAQIGVRVNEEFPLDKLDDIVVKLKEKFKLE